VAKVAGLPPGQKQPAQHGAERLRLEVGAGLGRDQFGCGVRLLASDAALLDGEAGDVAGGENVGQAAHAAVRVY
jgi:hypothetical protein